MTSIDERAKGRSVTRMDLWFDTLSNLIVTFMKRMTFLFKWIACSTPLTPVAIRRNWWHSLFLLIFREMLRPSHSRARSLILINGKMTSLCLERARFSDCCRPVNKFVFTMSDQSQARVFLSLAISQLPLGYPSETHKYSAAGVTVSVLTNLCVPRNLEPRVPRIRTA